MDNHVIILEPHYLQAPVLLPRFDAGPSRRVGVVRCQEFADGSANKRDAAKTTMMTIAGDKFALHCVSGVAWLGAISFR